MINTVYIFHLPLYGPLTLYILVQPFNVFHPVQVAVFVFRLKIFKTAPGSLV